MSTEDAHRISASLLAESPVLALEELAYSWSEAGRSRQLIYDIVLSFRDEHMDTKWWEDMEHAHGRDHPVDILLDRLWGWCSNHLALFPNEPFQTD